MEYSTLVLARADAHTDKECVCNATRTARASSPGLLFESWASCADDIDDPRAAGTPVPLGNMVIAVAAAAAAAADGVTTVVAPLPEGLPGRDSRKVEISTFKSAWQRAVKLSNMYSTSATFNSSPAALAAPPLAGVDVVELTSNDEANAVAIKGANRSSRNTSEVNADTKAAQLSGKSESSPFDWTGAAAPPRSPERLPPSREEEGVGGDDVELAVDVRLPGRLFEGVLPDIEDDGAAVGAALVSFLADLV